MAFKLYSDFMLFIAVTLVCAIIYSTYHFSVVWNTAEPYYEFGAFGVAFGLYLIFHEWGV
jgi:hypothetical protein